MVIVSFGVSWAIDETWRQYLIIICVVSIVLGLWKFAMMFLCVEELSVLVLTMITML